MNLDGHARDLLREYIDLDARAKAIVEIVDTQRLTRMLARLDSGQANIHLPEELYGFVPILVPDGVGGFERLEADEEIIEASGGFYFPDVLNAHMEAMDEAVLMIYSAFCGSMASYQDTLAANLGAEIELLELWLGRLRARLMLLYRGSQSAKRDLVKNDPTVVQLEDQKAETSLEKKQLEVKIKHVGRRVTLVSQELERRKAAFFREYKSGFGQAPSLNGPNPRHQLPGRRR